MNTNLIIVQSLIEDSRLMCVEFNGVVNIYQVQDWDRYPHVSLMIAQAKLKDNILSIVAYDENRRQAMNKTNSRLCTDVDLSDPGSLFEARQHISKISDNFIWTRTGITKKIKTSWVYLVIVQMRALVGGIGILSVFLLWVCYMNMKNGDLPNGVMALLPINAVLAVWLFRLTLKLANWND